MKVEPFRPSQEPTDLIPGDKMLLSVSTVISECKANGVMLFASPNAEGEYELTAEPVKPFDRFKAPVRLWRASTHHGISYLVPEDPGVSGMRSKWMINMVDLHALNGELADDNSEVRRLSSWPIERCFVYLDVSDFSLQRPGQQALIIRSIISMARNWKYWRTGFALAAFQAVEAMLCIGDGYIFVLKDPKHATYFAAYLANMIEARVARRREPVDFHFRMGVHFGPVYCFWDWGRGGPEETKKPIVDTATNQRNERGDWNYIGEGINGGQRVLGAAGKETDDVVFLSGQVKRELKAHNDGTLPCTSILGSLVNRGRHIDKHGGHWRLYELNHTQLIGNLGSSDILEEILGDG
jgi:hypothetical protein